MQLQLSAAESRRAQYALYVALVANSFALASKQLAPNDVIRDAVVQALQRRGGAAEGMKC